MIRVIGLFLVLFAVFFGLIQVVQKMTGKQALALTKLTFISIICSALALAVMFVLVALF